MSSKLFNKTYAGEKNPAKSPLQQKTTRSSGPFQALKKAVLYFANSLPVKKRTSFSIQP